MDIKEFELSALSDLYTPGNNSEGEDNGQITIIGGSSLFHGAPILALNAASRVVDMVFFSSPEPEIKNLATYIKSQVPCFVWVPFEEVETYIQKSDSVLIGPGFMRYHSDHGSQEANEEVFIKTKQNTERLLGSFPDKKWVIDAGSLQVVDQKFFPKGSILTPNKREFEMLASNKLPDLLEDRAKMVSDYAQTHSVVVLKGPKTIVSNGSSTYFVEGGNPGLTKGGSGDTQAGLTAALLAKNDPLLASLVASFVVKKAAERLAENFGTYFSSEDLSLEIFATLNLFRKQAVGQL